MEVTSFSRNMSVSAPGVSTAIFTLQWRHNGCDGVSNHQLPHCFAEPFIKVQIKENIKAARHLPLCREFTYVIYHDDLYALYYGVKVLCYPFPLIHIVFFLVFSSLPWSQFIAGLYWPRTSQSEGDTPRCHVLDYREWFLIKRSSSNLGGLTY